MAVTLFAAIDVGSFDLEMTIYQIMDKGLIKPVEQLKQSVAAGHDTYNKGRISYNHIEEICNALLGFKQVMESYHIKNYKAYGTSALREADNRDIVIDQIKVRTGIDVTVLGNATQRFLSYKAIALKQKNFEEIIKTGTLIADVGSGSTQLSVFDKDQLLFSQYMRLGTLRIREVFDTVSVDMHDNIGLIEDLIDADSQTFKRMYLKDRKIENLIFAGLCAQLLGRQKNGRRKEVLSRTEFNALYEKITSMSTYDLSRDMDISMEYADLLLPGVMIYKKIVDITEAEKIWLPGVILTDGIVAEYALSEKMIRFGHDFNQDILSSARSIAKRYKSNLKHGQNLETTALAIFDGMKKYHGLDKRERLLLQLASILHDCGKFVSITDPANCAYYIITSTPIIGLSADEQKMVANIVKYYSQDFDYEYLSEEGVDKLIVVAKLVAILKVAGILDRSHKQKIQSVKCTIRNNELVLTSDAEGDILLEENLLESRADFFEEVYGIRPVLRRKRNTRS